MNLTCARAVEALGAKWDEIDLAKKLWTIPAPRMKSNRQHIVPLSEAAAAHEYIESRKAVGRVLLIP